MCACTCSPAYSPLPPPALTLHRMTMVLSRTHADVAALVQGQAMVVMQHCVSQFAQKGDVTCRETAMKLSQVFRWVGVGVGVCVCVCVCACVCVCVCVCCVCMHACMYVCIYTCMYTCVRVSQPHSAHASCCPIVLSFAFDSISSAFQQAAAPSQSCRCMRDACVMCDV
jgi:hypothetical protein